MSRLDWHQGRFTADAETNRIFAGMAGWQYNFGDYITYYHLNQAATLSDDVYDEVTGDGREYYPPKRVPALHVIHVRGENDWGGQGYYTDDDMIAYISYDQFSQTGLLIADIDTNNYEMDRVVYQDKVFRIMSMAIRGQIGIHERPTLVTITGKQLKPDQMTDDATFSQYVEKWQ